MTESVLRVALLADATSINVQRWCEGLSHAGADIHILTFGGEMPTAKGLYRLPTMRIPGKLHYFTALPHVRRLICTIQPHVVIAYYVTGYGMLGSLAGYHPLVQVTAGSDVLLAPRSPIMRGLVRFTLSRADLVTAWAPHMAEAVERLGVAQERIVVLARGIPFQHFVNKRPPSPTDSASPYIISTRSLYPDYNAHVLVDAIRLLQDTGLTSFLTIAGEGPQRDELLALSQRLVLEPQVRFVGFVPNDQLPALLAKHNIYTSLVDSDGVSASLLEAMAIGLLPIVPDNAANRFWITSGENGLLLGDLSPASVAKAVREAILNLPLRQRAWQRNLQIVRDRADLYRNSAMFMEHFRRLATDYHN